MPVLRGKFRVGTERDRRRNETHLEREVSEFRQARLNRLVPSLVVEEHGVGDNS